MTARIVGFDTRAELGLAPPKSVSKRISPDRGGCAAHYGGPAQRLTGGHDQCRRRWRDWQKFHMGTHGWSDIAYTGGFCNHGYALAGRGFGVRTAANGVDSANDSFYAFAWLGGEQEEPDQAALDAFQWWVREARQHGKAGMAVKAHQDFKQTACAGRGLSEHARTWHNKDIPAQGPHEVVGAAPRQGTPDVDEEHEMVLVVCPEKPLCLLTRGRLFALQNNAQGDAYRAAGVPRRDITPEQWDALNSASRHLAGAGA